jgi:myo-inositol-1(or 4)-monophosphatase
MLANGAMKSEILLYPQFELDELELLAFEVLDAAKAVTVPLFRRHLSVHNKAGSAGFDPVTPADRWAERAMRELLAARVPGHGVDGEESGLAGGDTPHSVRWVIDPIDGTRSYMSGIPLWGTLVAACSGSEVVVGAIDHPALGERLIGSALGGRRIVGGAVLPLKVRPCALLADAVLCATEPESAEAFAGKVLCARYSTDCYGYSLLASGMVDVVVDTGLTIHDIAALVPVVHAAGGIITDWHGRSDFTSGRIIAAGDRRVHAQALSLL